MMNRNLMKQAQQLQQRLAKAQEELATMTVESSAGGGMITVVFTGEQKLKSIKIKPEIVDPADVEGLEDLILAALTEGFDKSRAMANQHMSKLTGGLNIPGL